MVEKIISDEKHVQSFPNAGGIAAGYLKEDNPGFIYFDNEHGGLVESEVVRNETLLRAATVLRRGNGALYIKGEYRSCQKWKGKKLTPAAFDQFTDRQDATVSSSRHRTAWPVTQA